MENPYKSQVEKLQKDNKKVFEISVEGADKTYYGYIRNPNRDEMRIIFSTISTDPIKAYEIILQNCWLTGDTEIRTDDDLFFGVTAQLGVVVDFAKASIKKL